MFFAHQVPSWLEIQSRVTFRHAYHCHGNYGPALSQGASSVVVLQRRVDSIRSAFFFAESEAAVLLRRRFSDLDISSILSELIAVVSDMAMIVLGSAVAGGAIGAGIGALGVGAGIAPFASAGALMGLQVSNWILGMLGLASIAEFFIESLPRVAEHYLRGINTAWSSVRANRGLLPYCSDNSFGTGYASREIAKGHEELVLLLLGAIVEYLTWGRGNARVLAHEMSASPKGARLGQWIVQHEDSLKQRPELQPKRRQYGAHAPGEPGAPEHGKPEQPHPKKSLGMPQHRVPCFNANKLPWGKIPEFERQLAGQERGLNELTVDEYLRGRATFVGKEAVRDPAVAKKARMSLSRNLELKKFLELTQEGVPMGLARSLAQKLTAEKMTTLAALHNPDMIAGGKDTITDFGDKRVNSSIGPQWRSRIAGLDSAALEVPFQVRQTTKIQAKLERCR